jgi:anthranilate synthase component 1
MKSAKPVPKYQVRALGAVEPLEVFYKAQDRGLDSFLFQSAVLGQELTVIGLGPFDVLQDSQGEAVLVSQGETTSLGLPFFEALSQTLKELQSDKATPCRFQNGGVFGCIGYDCISELEPKLQVLNKFQKAAGELPRAEVLIARRLIVFDPRADKIHLIEAGLTDDSTMMNLMQELLVVPKIKLAPEIKKTSSPDLEISELKPLLGPEKFASRVAKIKTHIREGDLFQAVLSERFEYQTKAAPLSVFKELQKLGSAPYNFYFPFESRAFFGASPETMARVHNGMASLNPIAGTRPRGSSPLLDQKMCRNLKRSPKEAAEHLMLVDLARNDLGRIAVAGSVAVPAFRTIQKLSNVMHLVSEVVAKVQEGLTALDVFKACFPAGTLSGAPKIRAMEILAEFETMSRGFYGGAVVAFDSSGNLDSCIAIRSLEMKGQTAILRAGAGIVADSKATNEYAEVHAKLKTVRQALAQAEASLELSQSQFDFESLQGPREKRVAL